MKGFIILILGIVAVLLVAGVAAITVLHQHGIGLNEIDSSTVSEIGDKVSSVATSGSGESSSDEGSSSIGDIVSEEVKFNGQNGEGYYKEVTYSDGGFRQYDTESGELIGSSYESDQGNLPSME